MAWVDTDYVDNVLGSTQLRSILFSVGGTFSATAFTQAEASARARVLSYIEQAGYSNPGETIDATTVSGALLADLVASLMIARAFARGRGIQWPPGIQDSVAASLADLESIRLGELPIPGMTASTTTGYGGVTTSVTSSSTSTSTRPQVFSRDALKRW